MRKEWRDPDYRARQSAAIRAATSTAKFRARMSAASRKVWRDPDYRARHRAAMRAVMSAPRGRARAQNGSANDARRRDSKVVAAEGSTRRRTAVRHWQVCGRGRHPQSDERDVQAARNRRGPTTMTYVGSSYGAASAKRLNRE